MRIISTTIVIVATGCSGFGSHTAKTLPPGKTEATLTVVTSTTDLEAPDLGNSAIGGDVSVRHGISRNADVGLRFLGAYNEVDLKLRLYQSETLHLAIEPILGYAVSLEGWGIGTAGLAALATLETTETIFLLAGVRAGGQYTFETGETDELRAAFIGFEVHGDTMFVRPCLEALSTPDYSIASLAVQFGGTR